MESSWSIEGSAMLERGVPRVYVALALRRRGASLAEVAASLPNARGDNLTRGVSEKTAELLLRSATRTLLTGVLRNRRPADLPDDLWPPESVRDDLRDIPRALSGRGRTDALRRWIEQKAQRAPRAQGRVAEGAHVTGLG